MRPSSDEVLSIHEEIMTSTASVKLQVGCIHLNLSFPYWATFAQGVSTGAAEQGVELCLPLVDAEEAWEAAIFDLVQQRPDIVILPHSLVTIFQRPISPSRPPASR